MEFNPIVDRLSKKDLGAFYTPMPYAKKAAELVQMAVDRIPDGNDYIILDRCAGTGNLECALIGLKDKNGDDLISHCVVSTYEYYEYKVLQERIGCDVREIIPPTEANVDYENGRVENANAMSEDFINNPIIKQYIDNPKCSVILFENPPYNDESSGLVDGEIFRSRKKNSYILDEMKKYVSGVATNELANRFIWSAQKYYLRQTTDCYVVFSPIKYWKQYSFVNMSAQKAFLFNRTEFHASSSAITCILWYNIPSEKIKISAEAYDIENNKIIKVADKEISKVFLPASKNYLKPVFSDDEQINVWCAKDGTEAVGKSIRVKSFHNYDVIGYLEADSFQIAPHVRNITVVCLYNGNGCYLTRNKYKRCLPIWVAKHVPLDKWYEKDIYATTADGGDTYTKDENFLKSCLIYTCLSNQNKCLSFDGSDGRRYQNELCFDNKALALKDLKKYETNDAIGPEGSFNWGCDPSLCDAPNHKFGRVAKKKGITLKKIALDKEEQKLLELWNKIIYEAKKTKNYNPDFNYGVYQIKKELNTSQVVGTGKNKKKVYDYPILNGYLNTLRTMLKAYYKSHITEKMFEYELLK